jgi:transposase-like protein
VSLFARELDRLAADLRRRPLETGPFTFCWLDALTRNVREGGRKVNMHTPDRHGRQQQRRLAGTLARAGGP